MLKCSCGTLDLCVGFQTAVLFLTSHLIGQITRTQFLLRGWGSFPYMENKCKAKLRVERVHVSGHKSFPSNLQVFSENGE